MSPMTEVVFSWTNAFGKTEQLSTKYAYAREMAIHLLELSQVDKISDIYYTVDNKVTRLDYFNTEL